MGIDSSTTGVAWTLVESGKPKKWGKIDTTKDKTMDARLHHIWVEFPSLLRELKPDHVYIEKSIYMRNVVTFRVLSYIVGSLILLCLAESIGVTDIEPMIAKKFYNYSTISRKFALALSKKMPTKDATKFKEALRKSQVQRVNEFNFAGFDASDHDISDSCSIAVYGYSQKVRPIKLDTSREVRLDLQELKKLGLDTLI